MYFPVALEELYLSKRRSRSGRDSRGLAWGRVGLQVVAEDKMMWGYM